MQLTVKKTIGKEHYTFLVEGKNLHELVMEAKKLSFYDIYKCGVCDSDKLYLDAYVTEKEGYEYTKIVCASCRASLTFGQVRKHPDTFFLRRKDDKAYDWQEYKGKDGTNENTDRSNPETEDDLPF